jgi:hypothetical protein
MNELMTEFRKFQASEPQNNPDMGGDEITQFLRRLSAEGKLKTYTEEEWTELGKNQGLDEGQIAELIEQAAGWLEQGEIKKEDQADWVGSINSPEDADRVTGQAQENPEGDEEDHEDEGCEGCVEDCDCEDGDEECDCESCETCEEDHKDDEEELDYCVCCCDCTEEEEGEDSR